MAYFKKIFTASLFIFCFSSVLTAATIDEIKKGMNEQETDNSFNAETSGSKIRSTSSAETDLKSVSDKLGADSDKLIKDKMLEQKPKIKLKVEAGDNCAVLNWAISGIESSAGQLKFKISYGIDSGNLNKSIDVGSNTSFKLRELKNNQIYYLQVSASSRDNSTKITSDEEQVIPLSDEQQNSRLESSYAKKSSTLQDNVEYIGISRELKQFGYDFFKNSQGALTNSENMPVGSDYVLGPGDVLKIDLWGSVNGRYELQIDRNGEITVPKVGVVKLWALSFPLAKDAIYKTVSRYYKNFEMNVTLGKLRSIQIFVVGEVKAPGEYSVNSLATVINALAAAGGPSKNGSLRSVKIQRSGRNIGEVDCYEMFINGDRTHDIRLENNDTIFVPVIGSVVALAGEVKRPAIYEIKDKTSLFDLLQTSGGIASTGDTGRIQLERYSANNNRIVLDIVPKAKGSLDDLKDFQLQDRDLVKIFPVAPALRHVVQLKGNVVSPGEYQLFPQMHLRDLIPTLDKLLPDSYLDSVEINRLALPDNHRETFSVSLKKAIAGDSKENIELKEQDIVRVYSQWEMQEKPVVSINGNVVNPGTYPFYPNMTVRDLLSASGSLKRNAYLDNAELTRVKVENGEAKSTHLFINLTKVLVGDPENNLTLQPDDTLIVRGIVNWLDANDRFVTLKGEFVYPGVYSITKGEKLSSIIRRAGGYTEKAYLPGAKFTRKAVQESQQQRMNEAIVRSEKDIFQKQGELATLSASKEELDATKAALEGLMGGLQRLKKLKAEGRVVLRIAPVDELEKSSYDLELAGGDVLDIPQKPSVVNVLGEVYNPTSLVHISGKPLTFYLKKAGGPMKNAEEDDMYVIKADGSVFSRQQSTYGINWNDDSRSWTLGGFMNSQLEPGDTIVIPQKLERTAWMRNIREITTIISQIALTAGTVVLGFK